MEQRIRNMCRRIKGICFKMYLMLHGCKVGKGLKCYSFPKIRAVPNKNVTIGNHVTFGYNCTIEVTANGALVIEDYVNITQNVLLSSNEKIEIGAYTLIGENVSIRDSSHGMKKGTKIQLQDSISKAVTIGKDVWIGANTILLKGSLLADETIIGANSLVNEKSKTKEGYIYAGSPIRLIKERI